MGGELALDAAWLFAAFLIIALLAAGGIAARRFLLERGGGTVECGLHKESRSWRLGVASYQREELCWFGSFGLSLRPDEVFPRRDLAVVSRRLPTDAEAATLGPGMIVVECHLGEDDGQLSSAVSGAPRPPPGGPGAGAPGAGGLLGAGDTPGAGGRGAPGPRDAPGRGGTRDPGESVELAMGEAALTGLLAWLEAAPPGSHLGVPL